MYGYTLEEALRRRISVVPVLIGRCSAAGGRGPYPNLSNSSLPVHPFASIRGRASDPIWRTYFSALWGCEEGLKFPWQISFIVSRSTSRTACPFRKLLRLLHKQIPSALLGKAVDGIAADVRQGACIADAMRRYPQVFDTAVTGLVSVGEETGNLDGMLERCAMLVECQHRYRHRPLASLHGQFALLKDSDLPLLRVLKILQGTVSQELVLPLGDLY